MANVDNPNGFRPVKMAFGAPYQGEVELFYKSASVILGVGDAVVLAGSADSVAKYPTITRAAAGSGTISGVMIDRDHRDIDQFGKRHFAAADSGYCMVATHPHLLFSIQEDSDSENMEADDVGEGVDIIVGNANTTTGRSIMELNSDNAATGDQCRIWGISGEPGNALGANCRWLVTINEHSLNAAQTMI